MKRSPTIFLTLTNKLKLIFILSFPGNGKGIKMKQNEKIDDESDSNDSRKRGENDLNKKKV